MGRIPVWCVVLFLSVALVAGASQKAKAKTEEGSDQPALPLATGYDALENQEASTLLASMGMGAGSPRLMEQLNLRPGIPGSSETGMVPAEYAAPSILTETSAHLTEAGPITATSMSNQAVTGSNDRFEEKSSEKDSVTANMQTALEEIKHDIVVKSKQVMEEKAWVAQVREIMQQYEMKVQRVETNINTLRGDVKTLYKKKRQIENLMLQEKLNSKLNDAKADLRTLDSALLHVQTKAKSFEKNKQDVASTVAIIKQQLNKLRGLPADAASDDDDAPAATA